MGLSIPPTLSLAVSYYWFLQVFFVSETQVFLGLSLPNVYLFILYINYSDCLVYRRFTYISETICSSAELFSEFIPEVKFS